MGLAPKPHSATFSSSETVQRLHRNLNRNEQSQNFEITTAGLIPHFLLPSPTFATYESEDVTVQCNHTLDPKRTHQRHCNKTQESQEIGKSRPKLQDKKGLSGSLHLSSVDSGFGLVVDWEQRMNRKLKTGKRNHSKNSMSNDGDQNSYNSTNQKGRERSLRDYSPKINTDESFKTENTRHNIRLGVNQWRAEWRESDNAERASRSRNNMMENKMQNGHEMAELERSEIGKRNSREEINLRKNSTRNLDKTEELERQSAGNILVRENLRKEAKKAQNSKTKDEGSKKDRLNHKKNRADARHIQNTSKSSEDYSSNESRYQGKHESYLSNQAQHRIHSQAQGTSESRRPSETRRLETEAARDIALRCVRAAERDRQRVLRFPTYSENGQPPPRDEYATPIEDTPPYQECLHPALDLVAFDTRYAPVLRVNRSLVHGEGELHAAITTFSECNLLPQSTDLWGISHVDDRHYEHMIPSLIPTTSYDESHF